MTATTSTVTFKRSLGLGTLVIYGMTSMGLLSVVAVYGSGTKLSNGHLPAAYLVAIIAMLFTAHSYGRMARYVPVTGSAYAYTARGFGPSIGFLTGWAMLLDYLFMPMVNFMLCGLYVNSLFAGIPVWAGTLGCMVLVAIFSVIGVAWVGRMNAFVAAASILVVITFVTLAVLNAPAVDLHTVLQSALPSDAGFGPIFAAAAVVAFAFLGFDGVSTLAEETKEPQKNIPRGVILATLGAGLCYFLFSLAGSLIMPDWTQIQNVDAAGTELMQKAGGDTLMVVFVVVNVLGLILCGTAAQMSVSRVLFAMGRDGLMPKALATLHPRFKTPYVAAGLVTLLCITALFLTLDQAVYMINFGALIAFAMVNLSAVKSLYVDRKLRGGMGTLRNLIMPLIGFAFVAWLWTQLSLLSFALGLAWLAVGVIVLVVRKRSGARVHLALDDEPAPAAEQPLETSLI